jgi:hypothetical protein
MVNAQDYLNKNYSKQIQELDLVNQELEGELIISDWPNLESIKCGNNPELTGIKLDNLPKLEHFHAGNCRLTNLTIDNCSNISDFNTSNNLLTDTDFLKSLNVGKLRFLSVHSNNFTEQDLSCFKNFVNLERLFIDNHDQKKFNQGIYNRWVGSLQPLQSLTSLDYLNIANTDISFGLEYLPVKLKKICLVNSWERKDGGCLNLKWEIERLIKLSKVEEDEPPFVRDWYKIDCWQQVQSSLIKGKLKNTFKQWNANEWLDENYPPHTNRQHYKELIISDKNLVGELDLSGFIGLKKLDCSDNVLTNLNLSNCEELIELNCANNRFANTIFLKRLPNVKNLEVLKINGNQELKESLEFLTPFSSLKELDISDCSFFGSLMVLKQAKELRKISIVNTDIDSGLEYLSDNCRELNSNPDSKKKSTRIAKLLAKHQEVASNKVIYYNLTKWREEWRNNIILSIPTERLYVIRSNIKQFINKWGKKDKKNMVELSKLQSPEELWKYRWGIYATQFVGRGAAVAGAALLFQDSQAIGGGIMATYPLAELVATKLTEKLKNKERKWEEFISDTENFLEHYHELLGMLEQFVEEYNLGEINEIINDLKVKTDELLKSYDENENGTIDLSELVEKETRQILVDDTKKEVDENNRLEEVISIIRKLEEKIIEYRRNSYREYYGIKRVNDHLSTPNSSLENQASHADRNHRREISENLIELREIRIDR